MKTLYALLLLRSLSAVGNILPSQEFNFHCDPESAYVTLQELQCPIKLVVLEPTISPEGAIDMDFYDREIVPLRTPKALFHHQIIRMTDARRRARGGPCALCDVNAMAVVLEPTVATKSCHVYCTVELSGSLTRSQVVVDWKGHLKRPANVELIQEYNLERFKELYKSIFD